MRKVFTSAIVLAGCLFGASAWAAAGDHFVVQATRETIEEVCRTHGLTLVRELGRSDQFLVRAPDGASRQAIELGIKANSQVAEVESQQVARTPNLGDSRPTQPVSQVVAALDRTPIDFYGSAAWTGYAQQAGALHIGVEHTRAEGQTGRGATVAVIDTGVDANHTLLRNSLVPGYDFTRDIAGGGSEWADLDQSTGAYLDQSTGAYLDQSTGAYLDAAPMPAAFGHGTMVAGLIHVVAPEARIMPLKAFRADGSSDLSDIVRAIYYAVDSGVQVINMSFHLETPSAAIKRAVEYATERGVVCVAAAGNEGIETLVYPAAYKRVIGVASTTLEDARAPFSNFGARLVEVTAPGENLITTYPGGRYAVVSGTSFSSGLVAGAVAVLAGLDHDLNYKDASGAFESSVFISPELGEGRIDIPEAVRLLELEGRGHGQQ